MVDGGIYDNGGSLADGGIYDNDKQCTAAVASVSAAGGIVAAGCAPAVQQQPGVETRRREGLGRRYQWGSHGGVALWLRAAKMTAPIR